MEEPMEIRKLTEEEVINYSKEIAKSRKYANSWVCGYKMKEMVREKTKDVVTLAKGEGGGWHVVGSCKIKPLIQ